MNAHRIFARHLPGLHYAVRIFIGTTGLWIVLRRIGDPHAIWAIISLIIITEPNVQLALTNFKSRIFNTLIGCAIGMVFLLAAGPRDWVLPVAITGTVLLSTYITKLEASWRIAPIAAVIVMSSGLMEHSRVGGVEAALQRTGEVFMGGGMALLVAWIMSKIWVPAHSEPHDPSTGSTGSPQASSG